MSPRSTAGAPKPGSSAYAMAKAALNQFCRGLAVELAPRGILVNAIAPGFIDTEMSIRPDGVNELETEWFRDELCRWPPFAACVARANRKRSPASPLSWRGRTPAISPARCITVDGGLTITF